MTIPALILGSTSPYRSSLLSKLGVRFQQQAPGVDETARPDEPAEQLALRLGQEKARAVAAHPVHRQPALVIGSDQVCHMAGEIYDKPGDHESARAHLARFSGQEVSFSTSLCLTHTDGREISGVENFHVQFRTLDDEQIEQYLLQDRPYDCAGAIKVELGGVSLLKTTRGRDINSLYGMPLMYFIDGLETLGYRINDFK